MGKNARSASEIDNNKFRKSRDVLDKREKTEALLASRTRKLSCPQYLSKDAKKEWKRIVTIDNSRAKPIIYDSDTSMLQALCEYWAGWFAAQKAWLEDPRPTWTIQTSTGEDRYIANPNLVLMDKYAKGMKPLYAAFAMTPQGRAQFGILNAKSGDDDDDDEFFD